MSSSACYIFGKKDYTYHCGVCRSGDCNEHYWQYCNQCTAYLCVTCRNDHSALSDLRKHQVISGPMLPYYTDFSQSSTPALMMFDQVLNLKVTSSLKKDIKLPRDEWEPIITSCLFLPSGELLVCDSWNKSLKRLDVNFTVIDSVNTGSIHDISLVDEVYAIVSLPSEMKLQYVYIKPQIMTTGRIITLDKRCYGIHVVGKLMFVSCYDEQGIVKGEIRMMDLYGWEKKRFDVTVDGVRLFDKPLYVTTTRDGNFFFVSDNGTNMVTCLNLAWDIIYQYSDHLKKARGLYVDSKGNIIVCSHAGHSVPVLTAAGDRHTVLLSYKDNGVIKPMCVGFRPCDGILVVGCEDQNELLIFRVQQDFDCAS